MQWLCDVMPIKSYLNLVSPRRLNGSNLTLGRVEIDACKCEPRIRFPKPIDSVELIALESSRSIIVVCEGLQIHLICVASRA